MASARRVGGLAVVASVPIPMTLSFDMASIHMGLMTLSSLAVAVAASVPMPFGVNDDTVFAGLRSFIGRGIGSRGIVGRRFGGGGIAGSGCLHITGRGNGSIGTGAACFQ